MVTAMVAQVVAGTAPSAVQQKTTCIVRRSKDISNSWVWDLALRLL
jgi:hypothetical protein